MSRKLPDNVPVPPVKSVEKTGWVTQTRKYKVITPLYGGGEEIQKADSVTVVRSTEVRGHLRFWWRATRGGAFGGNLEKMKQREEEIWGSPGGKGKGGREKPGPSKVIVRIIDWGKGDLIKKVKDKKGKMVDIGDPGSTWSYVAFPLREQENEPSGSVLSDVYFGVEIAYPQDLAGDVESAVWAWETFGGIGARTRRGFGALLCMKAVQNGKDITAPLPEPQNVVQTIKKGISDHVVAGKWPEGVPHISEKIRFYVTPKKEKPDWAWEYLFKALQDFRQKDARYDRKTGKKSEYGMSRWPEANAIRVAFGLSPKFPEGIPHKIIKKFPRGAFGLPIGFEMHHDKSIRERPELRGVEHDRLASPLVLRPIACSEGAVGLAAILEWDPMPGDERYTPPGGLILKDAPGDPQVFSKLEPDEAAQIPPLKGEKDILQAFLNFLEKSGGTN